jgi:hypothetical protein
MLAGIAGRENADPGIPIPATLSVDYRLPSGTVVLDVIIQSASGFVGVNFYS